MVSHESIRLSKMAMMGEEDDSKQFPADDSKNTPLNYGTDISKVKYVKRQESPIN